MSEKQNAGEDRQPVGNLTDFVSGVDKDHPLDIHVTVLDDGRIAIFHNKPFRNELSWLEFDLNTYKLDFILDSGDIRDAGMPLTRDVSKHMQNSHQVLIVLLDDKSGEAEEGKYVPVIIHRN